MRYLVFGVAALTAACGGDDNNQSDVDARVMTIEHDLSCLNNMPSTPPPTTIDLFAQLLDISEASVPIIQNGTVSVKSVDGQTTYGSMLMTGTDGIFDANVPSEDPLRIEFDAAGYPHLRSYTTIGAYFQNDATSALRVYGIKQSRAQDIATALGTTIDPTKGVLEVSISDCSNSDYPGATLSIAEDPGTQWAMYGGTGVWLPRATTLTHAANAFTSSAGTANLAPGLKHLSIEGGGTIGPVTLEIEPDTVTFLRVIPGYPR